MSCLNASGTFRSQSGTLRIWRSSLTQAGTRLYGSRPIAAWSDKRLRQSASASYWTLRAAVSAGQASHSRMWENFKSWVNPSCHACIRLMMHRTNRPRVSNRRATTGGPPRPCSVSLCPWAVHDGCYGVDPRGSVVVGGPADENPAGRRRSVPRWACAGQRSAGQAVDHGVSR